jgi:hypothetical protein
LRRAWFATIGLLVAVASASAAVTSETTLYAAWCAEDFATGFAWENGDWKKVDFEPDSIDIEKVARTTPGCADALKGTTDNRMQFLEFVYACYSISVGGASNAGGAPEACAEYWVKSANARALANVVCSTQRSLRFDPDGRFIYENARSDLSDDPPGGRKPPMVLSVGTCVVISP